MSRQSERRQESYYRDGLARIAGLKTTGYPMHEVRQQEAGIRKRILCHAKRPISQEVEEQIIDARRSSHRLNAQKMINHLEHYAYTPEDAVMFGAYIREQLGQAEEAIPGQSRLDVRIAEVQRESSVRFLKGYRARTNQEMAEQTSAFMEVWKWHSERQPMPRRRRRPIPSQDPG